LGRRLRVNPEAGDRRRFLSLAEAGDERFRLLLGRVGAVLLLVARLWRLVCLLPWSRGTIRRAAAWAAAHLAKASGLCFEGLAQLVDRDRLRCVDARLLGGAHDEESHAVGDFVRLKQPVAVGIGLAESFGEVESAAPASAAPAALFLRLSDVQ